jgi:hypothetical protein
MLMAARALSRANRRLRDTFVPSIEKEKEKEREKERKRGREREREGEREGGREGGRGELISALIARRCTWLDAFEDRDEVFKEFSSYRMTLSIKRITQSRDQRSL